MTKKDFVGTLLIEGVLDTTAFKKAFEGRILRVKYESDERLADISVFDDTAVPLKVLVLNNTGHETAKRIAEELGLEEVINPSTPSIYPLLWEGAIPSRSVIIFFDGSEDGHALIHHATELGFDVRVIPRQKLAVSPGEGRYTIGETNYTIETMIETMGKWARDWNIKPGFLRRR